MKRFTDYRLFKKCCRKYWKRHATKRIDYIHGKRLTSYWTDKEFCYYILNDAKELTRKDAYERYNFQYDIEEQDFIENINEWKSIIGAKVKATISSCDSVHYGEFGGFVVTNNQVNFLIYNDDNRDMTRLPLCWKIEKK